MEWYKLKELLDQPERLKSEVEVLRKATNLSEELNGFIALYDHFAGDVEKIKTYLNTSEVYIQRSQIQKKTIRSQAFKIAAISIVICLSLVGYLLFRPLPDTGQPTQKLAVDYLIEPGIPVYMSEHPILPWQKVMFPYKKGAYKSALKELEKIEKLAPQNDTVFYFKGVLNAKLKNTLVASEHFKRTIKVNSIFSFRAQFYLAKIDWESGNKQKAYKKMNELKMCNDPTVQQAVHSFIKDHPLNVESTGKKE